MPNSRQILNSMKDVLRPVGFKLSGTTFHRVSASQFVEVINLQGGMRSLAGKSAVNIALYIPEVEVLLTKTSSIEEARAVVTPRESACAIRGRLSVLAFGKDVWFDCNDPSICHTISGLLLSHGLPWFERFATIPAIVEELKAGRVSRPLGWGTHAAILKIAGETEAARAFLRDLKNIPPVNVQVFAARIGIDLQLTVQ